MSLSNMHFIAVKHNIEVAHRLFESPGKCENIHGHSMWVTIKLQGIIDKNGLLDGIDFGQLKKDFRGYLDEHFDHHVVLNHRDPFAMRLDTVDGTGLHLPGLKTIPGDPTTENIARMIGNHMSTLYNRVHTVTVWETAVNMAEWVR